MDPDDPGGERVVPELPEDSSQLLLRVVETAGEGRALEGPGRSLVGELETTGEGRALEGPW